MDTWSLDVTSRLLDRTICPRCGSRALEVGRCRNCNADLASPIAQQILDASVAAATAIDARQALIERMPLVALAGATLAPPTAAPSAGPDPTAPPAPASDDLPARDGGGSQISVQSVLAAAGAGLFAVAAIVFTFFNPEVDLVARTTIIAVVTALFLGGAWLFASRGLSFSAEAIGALGMVFLALDVWAFADAAPAGLSEWAFAGIGTLVASSLMIAVAAIVRLRTWLWLSLVGLALTPAFFGYAFGDPWATVIGHVGVGFVALGAHELARRLGPRFDSELRADRVTATIIELATIAVVVVSLFRLPEPAGGIVGLTFGIAAILGALAALAGLSTRTGHLPKIWSVLTGAFAVAAIAVIPLAFAELYEWQLALYPIAAAVALAGISLVPRTGSVRRLPLLGGALAVALALAFPAFVFAIGRVLSGLVWAFGRDLVDDMGAISCAVGLVGATAGVAVVAWRTDGELRRALTVLSGWLAALTILAAALWPGITDTAHVALLLGVALAASLALLLVPRIRNLRVGLRAPVVALAHLALLLGVTVAWVDLPLAIISGVAALGVAVAVAKTVPAAVRPVHVGIGFAYALLLFGTALDWSTILETLPILCLTATFGGVVALAATLTPVLRPGAWYAVLIVTTIPFLIAVGVLFVEIAGWTALSTGTMFLLALALVITRRAGLTILLRGAAAALLVPSLAVVVVALAAELLEASGSPVALPIIGVIVAVTLPTTGLVASALERRVGLSEDDARVVRFWIELSTLVTAAIAVILAFARDAAGPDIALLVFALIGLGGAATAFWARRRYGWIVAAIAWTGALWTGLGIAGVQLEVIEPYALPPALVAALVGAILVARGERAAIGLYAGGLGAAITPSLVVLAITGVTADGVPWRAFGLLAGSALLLALGVLVRGRRTADAAAGPGRWAPLRFPTLVFAIAAAASGAVQAVRYGWAFDPAPAWLDPAALMLVVLAFSVAGALLGGAAGRVATTGPGAAEAPSRWWYLAPLGYLVVGPMSAIDNQPLEIWTLWVLMIGLLGLVVATAWRARTREVTLPPIWFTFGLAWATGVVGWSQGGGVREVFRVEGWSLPMGAALLLAGVIAMPEAARRLELSIFNEWPIGFRGSWRLLGPGLVVVFLPSILATFTEAATWRAILVIALALASVLVGAFLRLRAPFILGLVVLVLENVFVLAIQVGRGVESVPWWITLATAGAALLAIAVRSERRTGKESGVGARLRDLE